MNKSIKNFISFLEIDLKDSKQTKEYVLAMRGLITTIFGVILGMGLEQLGDLFTKFSYLSLSTLVTAYLTVLLSWSGYHYGSIKGPETNGWNFVVDNLILFAYWFLINKRENMNEVVGCYTAIFILYTLWELIRCLNIKKEKMKDALLKAFLFNSLITVILLILFLLQYFEKLPTFEHRNGVIVVFIFFGMILYRWFMGKIYSPRGKNDK